MPVLGQRNGEHVLLRILDALLDGGGNFLGLAHADAHAALAVANDYQSGECEATAALDDLGDAIDIDDALLKLGNACLLFSCLRAIDLNPLLRTSGLLRGHHRPDCLDATVIQIATAVEYNLGDAVFLSLLADDHDRELQHHRR